MGLRDMENYRASGPSMLRLVRNGTGELPVTIERARRGGCRVSVELPPGIDAPDVYQQLENSGVVVWTFTPRKRGDFVVERCHVEAPSRGHLWLMRAHLPMRTELRVYPDLRGGPHCGSAFEPA